MSDVAPIDRSSTSDQVAAEVRRLIWKGELTAGERLNQDELATRFGVSRIPVREALIALAYAGVISMTPHRGAFVEPVTAEAVADIYELYARVDGFAIAKAVERGAELDQLIIEFRAAESATSNDELFESVITARRHLHLLGGSPRFDAVARGLVGLVPGNFFDEVVGAGAVARRRLPLIATALEDGQIEDAVEHYATMLRDQAGLVVSSLRANGALTESEHA